MTGSVTLALAGTLEAVPPSMLHALAAENIRLEAVCDSNGAAAETAARRCGARWPFDDLEQMLREAEPQAVIIAAPESQRTQWAKSCLRRRAAVLILGAPATTLAECRTLTAVARQANRQVMVGLAHRFSPAWLRARRLLESGRLGPLASLDIRIAWPRHAQLDDGAHLPLPFDLMFEAGDRLRSCSVVPGRIWAVERPYGHVAAMIVATDGVVASLTVHHSGTPQSAGSRLELRSEDGGLLVIEDDVNLDCTVGSQPVAHHQPRFGAGDEPHIECGHAGMITAFVNAVRDRQGVPYGLPSATPSVALADTIFRAARSGRPATFKP